MGPEIGMGLSARVGGRSNVTSASNSNFQYENGDRGYHRSTDGWLSGIRVTRALIITIHDSKGT